MVVKDGAKIDPECFDAFRFVDRSFERAMRDKDIKDGKGVKVGKILGSQYNVGTAVIDMPRLFKNGVDEKYFLEDQPVMLWQPMWMKLLEAQQQVEEQDQSMSPEEIKEMQGIKMEQGMRRPGDPIPK